MKAHSTQAQKFATLLAFAPFVRPFSQVPTKSVRGNTVGVSAAKNGSTALTLFSEQLKMTVTLPFGAKYIQTHYFESSEFPIDVSDIPETSLNSGKHGRFSEPVHSKNDLGQEMITVYFYNDSKCDRWVWISVDFK